MYCALERKKVSTNPAKGYYSILQFVPDLEKSEGANIGVVLILP